MRKTVLLAVSIATLFAGSAMAREAFWSDSNGKVVKDGQGNCLRTQFWTPEAGICPGEKKEVVAVAPAPTPAPQVIAVAPKASPASMPVITKHTLSAGALFEFGSAQLTPKAEQALAKVAQDTKGLVNLNLVLVEGHTDNIGSAAYNQKLSINRAMAVRDALIRDGIPAGKIEAKGYGFDKPVATNANKDGRSQNRRVEITISGNK